MGTAPDRPRTDPHGNVIPRRRWLVLLALRLATAAALAVDGFVHLADAGFYGPVNGAILSEGALFEVQGALALIAAAVLLAWPHRLVWVAAALIALAAFGAVVLYTYVDIGSILGLPDLYEPSWSPPGKLGSAIAEGAAVLLAATGFYLSRIRMARDERTLGNGNNRPSVR